MSFQTTSVKITGTPSASGWAQVHEFTPDDPEKFAKRGHLFAVISTARKEERVDPAEAGREILLRLHEEYFGNLETTAFYALKNSVQKVIAEFAEKWGRVEIAATSLLGEVVYSAAGGGGRISIFRGGNTAKILESAGDETVSASGYPKQGDFIILGTRSFFGTVSQGVIKASLEGPSLSSSVESLASVVHSDPDSGNIGCVIIKFDKEVSAGPADIAEPKPKLNLNLKPLFKRFLGFLLKAIPERKIYLKEQKLDEGISRGRKTTFWVGAILLILLLVSIGFGIKLNISKKFKSSYQDTLTAAKDQLIQAENLISADPAQARTLFADSQAKIQDLLSRKIKDKEIESLKKKLDEKEGEIMGIYKETPELYLDLSLLSSGFKGERLISSGENLYVLDKEGKKVVSITLATKKTNLLAGPDQADGILDIAAYEDGVYGVFADGIYSLGNKKTKVIDRDWQGEILAYAYTGNIYLLDKETGTVLRYQGVAGVFGSKQNWLAQGVKPNFTKAKQVFIDGSVWVLSDPFGILKFSLGSPQAFSPKGIFPEIGSAKSIYSNEENKYLYVLDTEEKRVVVLDKNGGYRAQYPTDKAGEATGLVVSEKEKKIILLLGSSLQAIGLKHL